MPATSTDVSTGQLLAVLDEALEGPKFDWTYFTDSGAESGLFGTLASITAAEASKAWAGSTIAAHAGHVAFALEASAAWIAGDRSSRDWPESWSVHFVDDAAWKAMQRRLRDHYAILRQAIAAHGHTGDEALGGSIAALAHTAYHLGAIRQKVAASRSERA